MKIRKNNDIRFLLILVDNAGNPVTNIKDVKCTVVNSGLPHLHSNHFHFKHWHMYREHGKLMHSVMCGYDHPYNVLPVNTKEYCVPFIEDIHKLIPGTETLPIMVNQAKGTVDAYFAARKQKIAGKYNMIVEIQCWDPTWADGGIHTHTVLFDDVVELTDGDNRGQVSPATIRLNIILPHSDEKPAPEDALVPTVYYGDCDADHVVTIDDIRSADIMGTNFTWPAGKFFIMYPDTVSVYFNSPGIHGGLQVHLDKDMHAIGPAAQTFEFKGKGVYNNTEYIIAVCELSPYSELQTIAAVMQ